MRELYLKLNWGSLWTGFLFVFIISFAAVFFALIAPLSGQTDLVNGFNFLIIPGVGIHWGFISAFVVFFSLLGGGITYLAAKKHKKENGIAMALISFVYSACFLLLVSNLLLFLALLLNTTHS